MATHELLYPESISIRQLPENFIPDDRSLFEHELRRPISPTLLLRYLDVTANHVGILHRQGKVLAESFPSPLFAKSWRGVLARMQVAVASLLKPHKTIPHDVCWITDTWSHNYFHWMTDCLPRLFAVINRAGHLTLLLPSSFAGREYIRPSLEPFRLGDLQFLDGNAYCVSLTLPSHTARTGNYNEQAIRGLRSLFANSYASTQGLGDRIYVSRSKAARRRIANESECVAMLEQYGFETVHFEEHSFEQQMRISQDAQYLISNHGAGLTNMLFMRPGSKVLELRKKGDARNNCYFALASALDLKYFYQLCNSKRPNENAHTADLIVDCRTLKATVEQMLTN